MQQARELIESGDSIKLCDAITGDESLKTAKDEHGQTLLHYAAAFNQQALCTLLLEMMQDPASIVNAEDDRGIRPIQLTRDIATLDALIKKGAQFPNLPMPFSSKPELHQTKAAPKAPSPVTVAPPTSMPADSAQSHATQNTVTSTAVSAPRPKYASPFSTTFAAPRTPASGLFSSPLHHRPLTRGLGAAAAPVTSQRTTTVANGDKFSVGQIQDGELVMLSDAVQLIKDGKQLTLLMAPPYASGFGLKLRRMSQSSQLVFEKDAHDHYTININRPELSDSIKVLEQLMSVMKIEPRAQTTPNI